MEPQTNLYVDDTESLGPCPDCTHDLANHEGDGYSRGPCLEPGCFCDHEDEIVSAERWAAVTGLVEEWRRDSHALRNKGVSARAQVYATCATELERVTKGEG